MRKGGLDIGADAALLHIQQLCMSGAAIAYSGPGCAYRDKEWTFSSTSATRTIASGWKAATQASTALVNACNACHLMKMKVS